MQKLKWFISGFYSLNSVIFLLFLVTGTSKVLGEPEGIIEDKHFYKCEATCGFEVWEWYCGYQVPQDDSSCVKRFRYKREIGAYDGKFVKEVTHNEATSIFLERSSHWCQEETKPQRHYQYATFEKCSSSATATTPGGGAYSYYCGPKVVYDLKCNIISREEAIPADPPPPPDIDEDQIIKNKEPMTFILPGSVATFTIPAGGIIIRPKESLMCFHYGAQVSCGNIHEGVPRQNNLCWFRFVATDTPRLVTEGPRSTTVSTRLALSETSAIPGREGESLPRMGNLFVEVPFGLAGIVSFGCNNSDGSLFHGPTIGDLRRNFGKMLKLELTPPEEIPVLFEVNTND